MIGLQMHELAGSGGTDLGVSPWRLVAQEQIDQFAMATGDDEWIHVDTERAKDGPYGNTIAHGYLTLSLWPVLMTHLWRLEGSSMGLNYGINRLRFLSPVTANSRIRLKASIADATELSRGRVRVTFDLTVELEGSDKPALVAETVGMYTAAGA
jgi:acyl dehydratase